MRIPFLAFFCLLAAGLAALALFPNEAVLVLLGLLVVCVVFLCAIGWALISYRRGGGR
jgi:hypothetical protein